MPSFTSMAARVSSKQTPAGSHVKKSVSKSSRPHDFLWHWIHQPWDQFQTKGNAKGREPRWRVKNLGGVPHHTMMVMALRMIMRMEWHSSVSFFGLETAATQPWSSFCCEHIGNPAKGIQYERGNGIERSNAPTWQKGLDQIQAYPKSTV